MSSSYSISVVYFFFICSNLLGSVAAVVNLFHFYSLNYGNMCYQSVKGNFKCTDNIICCFVLVSTGACPSDEG